MDALDRYLEEHRGRFLENLKAVLRIPSVSAQPQHKADVRRCAEHIAAQLKRIGMTRAEVVDTPGHPVVYAEWLGAPGKPTFVSPVRRPCWPVRNAARPAVHDCSP